MFSIFENTHLHNVFMICGNLQDMFMTGDLQKMDFEHLLNIHLRKELGYKQIVYYSAAKNKGKYVLDDESARLAINANKKPAGTGNPAVAGNPAGAAAPQPNIRNPRARNKASAAQPQEAQDKAAQPLQAEDAPQKLIYEQRNMTSAVFLAEAKAMMEQRENKTAVVFVNFDDFTNDPTNPQQPYRELVSSIWGNWAGSPNENICIFLANGKTSKNLLDVFDRIQGGDTFKNKFFNSDDKVNKDTLIEVVQPSLDEIGFLLDHYRIVGEVGEGGRMSYAVKEREKFSRKIMFYSRETSKDSKERGSLRAMDAILKKHVKDAKKIGAEAELGEDDIKRLFPSESVDEPDALDKLKNTRGWEAIYKRINEIIKDIELKRAEHEAKMKKTGGEKAKVSFLPQYANERIMAEEPEQFFYPVPHFIFRGSPGVGKTTIARLIGEIFYNAGILKKGFTIEAKRDDLVAGYVGQTAIKTTECVERARDGVLFIDDAYSLFQKEGEHNFPKEAMDTLTAIMTNPAYHFCLIMAGYPDPMDELLTMNAGLRGRFGEPNILTIDDYRPDVLRDIFIGSCKKRGFRIWGGEEGEDKPLDLDLFFTNLYNQRDRSNFGNARDVVAIANEAMLQSSIRDRASRCIVKQDFGANVNMFERRGVSSINDIYSKLDEYVGFDFIKKIFEDAANRIEADKEDMARGVPVKDLPDHYVFAGNPGTGKTTVGKLMGEFYHLLGVLGGRETLFKDASELVGAHYGDAPKRVREVFKEAIDKNTTLYIDEAYQLTDSGYADQTVGAMMTAMTENAADFKVIFGMYENRVDEFLKLNAGLSRRLQVIHFPDYTPEQLMEIFERGVKRQQCTASDEVLDRVREILKRMYDARTAEFGNAGEVEKILGKMRTNRYARAKAMPSDDPLKYEYSLADIPPELLAII